MSGEAERIVWRRGAWHFAEPGTPGRALCWASLDGGRVLRPGEPARPMVLCETCCRITRKAALVEREQEREREAAHLELARRQAGGRLIIAPPVEGEQ